jgi:DNA repair exonuclease SbcCD ATPase subunit
LLFQSAVKLEGLMQLTDEPDEFLQTRSYGRRNYVTVAASAAGVVMLSVIVVALFSNLAPNERIAAPPGQNSAAAENSVLEQRRNELQAQINKLQQEIDRDSQDVAGLRAMAESSRREVAALEEQRKAEQAAIEALTKQREAEQAALDAHRPSLPGTPGTPLSAGADTPSQQPGQQQPGQQQPGTAAVTAPPSAAATAASVPPPTLPPDTTQADPAPVPVQSSEVYLHLARESLQQGHSDDALVALNEAENRLGAEASRLRARNIARIRVARRAIYRGDVKRALRNIDAILRTS